MKVSPSILSADFNHLKHELKRIETADFVHLDIMDGHFVPNISFGPDISKQIHDMTTLDADVHLMVTNPLDWVSKFAFSKTKFITIHVEAHAVEQALNQIAKLNIGRGISLRPGTDISALLPYLDKVELVLVMTVEPGFGGQSLIPEMLEKVKTLVALRKAKGYHYQIEADGGINDQNITLCKAAGVDMVVAGSFIMKSVDAAASIKRLK